MPPTPLISQGKIAGQELIPKLNQQHQPELDPLHKSSMCQLALWAHLWGSWVQMGFKGALFQTIILTFCFHVIPTTSLKMPSVAEALAVETEEFSLIRCFNNIDHDLPVFLREVK